MDKRQRAMDWLRENGHVRGMTYEDDVTSLDVEFSAIRAPLEAENTRLREAMQNVAKLLEFLQVPDPNAMQTLIEILGIINAALFGSSTWLALHDAETVERCRVACDEQAAKHTTGLCDYINPSNAAHCRECAAAVRALAPAPPEPQP